KLGKIKYLLEKGDKETINTYLSSLNKTMLETNNQILSNVLSKYGYNISFKREKIVDIIKLLQDDGFNEEEAINFLAETLTSYSNEKLRDEMTNKDLLITHAINAYDEYTEMINILYERLREWYGVYFPELKDFVKKIDRYASLIRDILVREEYIEETLIERGYPEDRAKKISDASKKSTGGMLSREDLEIIRSHAIQILNLIDLREELDKYLKNLLEEEAPNISRLIGHKLAARLIAKAGGIRKLATLPSSTIQLLGAEKSLFLALRRGGRPPKHGVIFQHPFINQSPKVIRGRIARLLAGKIAIAARVDAFGGEFVGDKLLSEVSNRVEELRREAPNITAKKKVSLRKKKRRRRKSKG
ncbi:TPA: C/D box methylation guide ribonucleoprotein complex aNOP56 subunit, partial [Candidatus Geothermarchaeota archaeon]|nr:C/D box methylation guide ribonucleoprotein complex aNOP56 subunit [Candidatus Geothermarchaeota archaeon]